LSFGSLRPHTGLKPYPQFTRRLVGVSPTKVRKPIYIGLTANGEPTYIIFPSDISFLVKILMEGPSTVGKSVAVRDLLEGLFLEWKSNPYMRHSCIIYDWKGNYLGITSENRRHRDRVLLRDIHGINRGLSIHEDMVNVYVPSYVAPTRRREILRELKERYMVKGFWGLPWRYISDLRYLAMVLKVPTETLWHQALQPAFDKASKDKSITFNDFIKEGGILEARAKSIGNATMRNAALAFVRRWRSIKYVFSEDDVLARHLGDDFGINVLTFLPVAEKTYYNQLAFLISLESLMSSLQMLNKVCQPCIVCHDILNWVGEGKPFRSAIIDVLLRMISGQARSLKHGYIVVFETRSFDDLPRELKNLKDYTIHFKFMWKSESPSLRYVRGFIGGVANIRDRFHNFYRNSVIIRPPMSHYQA